MSSYFYATVIKVWLIEYRYHLMVTIQVMCSLNYITRLIYLNFQCFIKLSNLKH